jgi:L-histidine N-alpha-methyltransferase
VVVNGSEPERIEDPGRFSVRFLGRGGAAPTLADDVRCGLGSRPRSLPPKYFYDERGSWLFEKICGTPEYYPTRVEDRLLARHSAEIIDLVEPRVIVELGSGSSRKTSHMIDACERASCHAVYQPVDVCREMLEEAGRRLCAAHDWLQVDALVGDYCSGLEGLGASAGPRLFMFLGGTVGNFDDAEAADFLGALRGIMGVHDRLLMGADRVKDAGVLNAAYNDAQGYTAAFNRNVLEVINRELGADFDSDNFQHLAWFNEPESRIEMHLRATAGQQVHIAELGMVAMFEPGETILTEISRKFTPEDLEGLLGAAGLEMERHFAPDNGYYSLVLARPGEG